MKYLLLIPLLVCQLALAEIQHSDCDKTAKSQADINECSSEKFNDADEELNSVYKDIVKKYEKNPEFLNKLKNSQRAWLKFRDAELDALFPATEPGYYGSAKGMCVGEWLMIITAERTKQLKKWLNPIKAGDEMCSGSIGEFETSKF